MKIVEFYSSRGNYGFMSNFARYPVIVDEVRYKTSEHYYQSMKFLGTKWEKKVRDADTPMEAATLGRNKNFHCVEIGSQLKMILCER